MSAAKSDNNDQIQSPFSCGVDWSVMQRIYKDDVMMDLININFKAICGNSPHNKFAAWRYYSTYSFSAVKNNGIQFREDLKTTDESKFISYIKCELQNL